MVKDDTNYNNSYGTTNGSTSLPLNFYLSLQCERRTILKEIFLCIYKIAGDEAAMLRVALGEAIINALRYGISIRIKINVIGNKLVIRVKDDGPGFDGNSLIEKYLAEGKEKIFNSGIYEEHGRGIKIMLLWTNLVTYNKQGNEVLLVKEIATNRNPLQC